MYNKHEALHMFNNTEKNCRLDLCLHELFEKQVALTPDAEAICFDDTRISFTELNDRSNQCGHYLREMGVSPNNIVGMLMDRSLEMIIALLGILKSGGSYLPLDPNYPGEKLNLILKESSVSIVLTQKKYEDWLEDFDGTTLNLDSEWSYLTKESKTNLANITVPQDLCYTIYTSGSMGKSNVHMISHKAICSRLVSMQRYYQITDQDRILLKTPFALDVSVWELFLPLVSGACLLIEKQDGHQENHDLIEKQLNYWQRQFADLPPILELPTYHSRSIVKTSRADTCCGVHNFHFSAELLKQLNQLSQRQEMTLYMTLLSAFAILLSRYSGQTDISIGSPIENRNRSKIEDLTGCFVNMLMMRTDVSGDPFFIDLLSRIKEIVSNAKAHQDIPFEYLLETLKTKQGKNSLPFFQVIFDLKNTPPDNVPISDFSLLSMELAFDPAKFDLILSMQETSTGLQCSVKYNTDLWDSVTIQQFMEHYEMLLIAIVADPEARLSQFDMLSSQERHQLLVERNNTQSYSKEECIHELFEKQVEQTPNNVAVVFKDQKLTYYELNQRANQVAHYLHQKGVKPDTLVGLCVERSLEIVIGILGIIKAGGAYVPIDPNYPEERIRYLLDNSKVDLLLSQSHLSGRFPISNQQLMYLDTDSDDQGNVGIFSSQPTRNIAKNKIHLSSRNLAYVIYTSGSTGRPNGVTIEHQNVTRLFHSTQKEFCFNQNDIWTLFHSFAFDFSVWEIWGALIYGGKLIVVPKRIAQSPMDFYKLLISENVTILNQTPRVFEGLIEIDQKEQGNLSLRTVIFGGEALNPSRLIPWFDRHDDKSIQLVNMYGITETTVHVTYQRLYRDEIASDQKSNIGKKLSDLTLYVLDDHLSPVPSGITGELYVGGAGLARGYLNNIELTQKRFIQNRFSDTPNDRLYKTGDLARWLPDGNLEYIGRADDQLKIRGFRIELGEIEIALSKHKSIEQSVVLVKEKENRDPKLVAYVVTNEELSAKQIRKFVKKSLPDYMIPNIIVSLDSMPVTQHGKIDRKALPWPLNEGVSENKYLLKHIEKPKVSRKENEFSAEILGYFIKVLGTKELTTNDDLFESGATSFTMVQVVEQIQGDYGVTIPVEVFLDTPTVQAIADYLEKTLESKVDQHSEYKRQHFEETNTGLLTDNVRLEAELLGYFSNVLGTKELTTSDDLFESGATSFTMVQVVEQIQSDYDVTIPVEVFLDTPTVEAIADYLGKKIASKVNSGHRNKKKNITENYDINLQQDKTSKEIENLETGIKLQEINFCDEAYNRIFLNRDYSDQTIPLELFGRFLSLLRQGNVKQEAKYLYASAGGLNPIQTYLYIKKNGVEGLEEGVYYYHPKQHCLYPLGIGAKIKQSIFFEYDRPVFYHAGFAVFFIAQLKALMPIYKDYSLVLSILEAGYMGQLLTSRQADFNLGLSPVSGVDFEKISDFFQLDEGHKFVHCIFGGMPDVPHSSPLDKQQVSLYEYLQKTNKGIHEHCSNYTYPVRFSSISKVKNENLRFPTKEEKEQLQGHVNIRQFSEGDICIKLKQQDFKDHYYKLRSTKRDYVDKSVPFDLFSKFLSLLRQKHIDEQPKFLYSSVTGNCSLKIYLYIKENGVQGISKGVYYYNPTQHEILFITSNLSEELKSCYTPFNRKQVKKSKFCLFLIAPLGELKKTYKEDSTYLALLDAGYMGQLLMDKQAEFEMGVCPIGGLLFDKIRADFQLHPQDQLLHSFVCGSHELEMPTDWKYLETARRKVDVSAAPYPESEENKAVGLRQDIAIVGMSGRYPGAESLDQFWENLKEGKNSFKDLSFDKADQYRRGDLPNNNPHHFNHRGAFLNDVDCFDSLLFKVAPVEARSIDPQERLLMEVVWECLENGGYTSDELNRVSNRVGVFVGAMWDDYQHYTIDNEKDGQNIPVISLHSSIPNHISHFFEFNGPSISLNTSCSSAMTAIHYACNSIKNGECQAAIVGGVNIMSHPYHYQMLKSLDLLSKDGQCRPFGKQGNGIVVGEGVGAILIKPKQDAERDGDYIHGIIKGTAVGFSGRSVRNGTSKSKMQRESILNAIKNSGVSLNSISYVEAAAPGASIADATEMVAVKEVFQNPDDDRPTVYVGSVKANIGHLESASAMSQLMKILLQMKHQLICPTINVGPVNPLIQLEESGLKIVNALRSWDRFCQQDDAQLERKYLPRRALINAFGATGTGGHAIIEEYINNETSEKEKRHLILLSAATEQQLKQSAKRLYDSLADATLPLFRLTDIAYTLRIGRTEMVERLAMVVKSHSELQQKLHDYIQGLEEISDVFKGSAVDKEMVEAHQKETDFLFIAEKWAHGTKFSWKNFDEGYEKRVPLPTYPFARERHWISKESRISEDVRSESCKQNNQLISGNSFKGGKDFSAGEDGLLMKVEHYLKNIFSEVSEIPVSRINSESTFDEYGINSLMITKLNVSLKKDFGDLSKTLFFEYQTVHELAKYFLHYHSNELKKMFTFSKPLIDEKMENYSFRKLSAEEKRHYLSFSDSQEKKECEVAIVGLSGKYPKSETIEEYWENLKNGVDCISEIPKERWDYRNYYEQDKTIPGKIHSKWGGFIKGIDQFDPLFFNISPREAEFMDPQERLFLQTVWHTLEDAGYAPSCKEIFKKKIGVFVGVMYGEYQLFSPSNNRACNALAIGSSYGSTANRVSYLLNLTGPSMAIDTLCSSSLTALHLAVKSIKSGECEAAIVGGVNLSIHPNKYIMQAQGNMSSTDGRCRSFGEGGDGFVPSEGVGAILIKPLNKAIDDRDHIYATIKGTSINNDGKTHGYTVPNPNAQADLILRALDESKINPEWISYIEAHGTGTSLGDPVEITGLTKAFKTYTEKTQYCSIGSVKSNIGHTEAAAGIAGLTKILLQMKHQLLVPSLHSKNLNSNINFEKSPVYVQQELSEWKRPKIETDGEIKEYPRIACISSFGAGGSNAHAIIEEYLIKEDNNLKENPVISFSKPVMVPLSARNRERLLEYAKSLFQFVQNDDRFDSHNNLTNLAYTLQVGREVMEDRLGLIVSSKEDLCEKLKSFFEGKENIEGFYLGEVKKDKNILSVFTTDEDMATIVETWISKGKYHKLLDLWVKGFNFDWSILYGENKPKRISAPTYPFAKERYWVENNVTISESKSHLSMIHPLLHENTSDLSEQRFTSRFTGTEFFLRDHQIKGEKVLPGVGYLEMARAAVERASGKLEPGTSIQINNVVWTQPIVVNGVAKAVHIGLFEEDSERIHYEVYSESETDEEIIVHSQGMAEFKVKEAPSRLDIGEIQSQMTQGILNAESCYQAFNALGIEYGAGHQGIREIYKGDNQVLAKLSLPSSLTDTQQDYTLHPSLMDSALQSSIGFVLNSDLLKNEKEALKVNLPFALESLEIISSCTSDMYAWVRSSDSTATNKVQKLDIDLFDEHGNVCVKMRGFSSRVLERDIGIPHSKEDALKDDTIGTLLATPVWKAAPVVSDQKPDLKQQAYSQHRIVLCELEGIKPDELEKWVSGSQCLTLTSKEKTMASRYTDYAVTCFEMIKAMLEGKSQGKSIIQILLPNTQEQSLFSGLSSLLKTAALENPKIVGQLIQVDPNDKVEGLAEKLQENKYLPYDSVLKYENDKRLLLTWEEIKATIEQSASSFKESAFKKGGVYLITGGVGGLGLLFAKEIVKHTNEARLVLTGRSELSAQKQALLQELVTQGGHVEYQTVDVSELEQVTTLIESIQHNHNQLDGIIHCAGVISDNFILKKTVDEFRKVLFPKVTGTLNLDTATQNITLDFFVLFSSSTGAMGNLGQADYATANAFMDQFAGYRNQLVSTQQRSGHTLSINWPFWKAGGMRVDEDTETMIRQSTGMIAMQTETGINAFYQSLNSNNSQILVVEGLLRKIRAAILETKKIPMPEEPIEAEPIASLDPKTLEEKSQQYLKKQFSSALKLPLREIDLEAPLENYGMDSILAISLTNQLEKTFGSLPKTLFFEYQTIAELTGFFVQSYQSKLLSLFHKDSVTLKKPNSPELSAKASTLSVRKRKRHTLGFSPAMSRNGRSGAGALDIAIVGLSGRYPQSINLQDYWKNLREGKDCITEVPKERWDWKEYFSEDRSKKGVHYSKWGGFIEGVDEFDPLFFNISPREAMAIDPQERLFLEHVWMAIEDAGYTREGLHKLTSEDSAGQVGVYAGVMFGEYQLFGAEESLKGNRMALAGTQASIANRVSYVFNLHGPSMTVDTMCSSSLTAIHLACQDLKHHKTDLGIAGGVNITIHPNKYLGLSETQFISAKGHCESFGEGGDGYIPAEGVGVVLLKRLQDAIQDEDHIYGVILGSAINHGGKTNGYTVPNPKAQRSAIEMALSESKIDPNRVSYIEAHGTGTKLGDPIEIAALSQAFGKITQERGFCRIGSAKSNIGHCEGAAGIAGLTKVLLQMKYQQIVPSLHSSMLNPNIDFETTPFVVNQELRDWERSVVDKQELPFIAGVSSFGAGGSNAHLIVTEYQNAKKASVAEIAVSSSPVIVPLSAKTQAQLLEATRNLLDFINVEEGGNTSSLDLFNLSYTLQVGREAMEERLGFIVSSIDQLQEKLRAYIDGQKDIEDVYQGQVKRNKEALAVFTGDEELQEAIEKWIDRKKISKLLDLWVKGFQFDWNKCYGNVKPKRISLPTYPFAKEKYWYSEIRTRGVSSTLGVGVSVIHPLLHENTSNLSEQRFTSRFTGTEFFLREHRIKGENVLPGVGYLEMVRAAVERASGELEKGTSIQLKNVVWAQPIVVNGVAKEVHIGLFREDNEKIQYEVYSGTGNDEESIVHFQGIAEFKVNSSSIIDIDKLRPQMTQGTLNAETCYRVFKAMGMDYGPGYQGIQEIHQGENQALAKLSLPSSLTETQQDYTLHPCLMDSAIQSSISLMLKNDLTPDGREPSLKPNLPFTLESVEILAPCTSNMYAWVRYSGGSVQSENIQKLDIELCDLEGNVCVKIRGLEYQSETFYFIERQEETSTPAPQNLKELSLTEKKEQTVTRENLEKPTDIHLLNASTIAAVDSFSAEAIMKEPSIRLSNHSSESFVQERKNSNSSSVKLYNYGKGIFSIQISEPKTINALSEVLIQELFQTFTRAEKEKQLKVLIIVGSDSWFLTGGRTQLNEVIKHKLHEKIASFSFPTIAAMKGNAVGAGFLIGSLCDFMICSKESQYCYTNSRDGFFPTEQEESLLIERFGEVQAKDFLYSPGVPSGKELKMKGWSCPFFPQDQVDSYAQELATIFADMPQESLRELKQHLSRRIYLRAKKLKVIDIPPITEKFQEEQDKLNSIYMDQRIICSSNLVQVETYEEKILLIRVLRSEPKQSIDPLILALEDLFSQLQDSTQYGAVVLVSSNSEFLPIEQMKYGSAIHRFQNLFLQSKIPVIAALDSNARNAAWLISLFCDACIYNEKGCYSYGEIANSQILSKEAVELFSLRFGHHLAKEILFTGTQYTGNELQQRLKTLTAVPSDQVLSTALQLAKSWSSLSSSTLFCWKQRIFSKIQQLKILPAWKEENSEEIHHLSDIPTKIPLNSKVVEATVHSKGIVVVKMADREAKNLFSEAIARGITEVFQHIEQTPTYKVVILTGYDTYFAAGGTKEGLIAIQEGTLKYSDVPIYEFPIHCKIPVISAMQGHGIGAGWTLGMFSDFIFFSKESVYSTRFMSYGFTPGAGSTLLFPHQLGVDLSREYLMTAKEYKGNEILDRGVQMPVLPRKQVFQSAMALAQKMAQFPRGTLVALKQQFTQTLRNQLEETYQLELAMHDKTFVNSSEALSQIQRKFNQDIKETSKLVKKEEIFTNSKKSLKDTILHSIKPTLKKLLSEELYLDEEKIGEDTQFLDLGLDSITGVTWVRKINKMYKIDIPVTEIYSHPTISALTAYVRKEVEKKGNLTINPADDTSLHNKVLLELEEKDKPAIKPGDMEEISTPVKQEEKPIVSNKFLNDTTLDSIKTTLRKLLSEELYLGEEKIGEDTQFLDLGLDSITGVTWVRKINQVYEIDIPVTEIYSHPTLSELTAYVRKELEKKGNLTINSVDGSSLHNMVLLEVEEKDKPAIKPGDMEEISTPFKQEEKPIISNKLLNDTTLDSIKPTLKKLLSEELYLDEEKIGVDTQFLDLGLDSITGVTWVRKINQVYKIDIPVTEIYSHPTLSELTTYVRKELEKKGNLTIKEDDDVSSYNTVHLSSSIKRVPFSRPQSKRRITREATSSVRRAGIGAFETTGSNAHVILEEVSKEDKQTQTTIKDGVLLPLSARNIEYLREYARRILLFLKANPETDLLSLAYTLQTERVAMEERLILFVNSIEEATQNLTDWLNSTSDLQTQTIK